MPVQTKLNYLTNRELFSNYYLENLLPETDRWKDVDEEELRSAFNKIKELYEDHKEYIHTYQEDFLEDKFIRPIFEELGFEYGTREQLKEKQRFPDYGLFEDVEARQNAYKNKDKDDFYKNAITIAEAKRWNRNLDKREGIRDFTNPSHQVYVYQQETDVDWAILTSGKVWRLYYSKTSHKLDSYYEIDLPTLLESDKEDKLEAFKYFYLFFRKKAFLKDKRDKSFLDRVYDKSHIFSQELGENLKENIYEAIKLLAEGFLKFPQNDLDPEEDLDLIHDSSLVYLYRMIFVLYAESEGRDLLDTNNKIYNDEYSLNTLKQEVCEELEESSPSYKDWQHNLWDKLEELFLLIDKGSKNMGIPEDDLYIPAYNGGLFKTEIDDDAGKENVFLQQNKVGDSYLAEVIDLLTRHESDNGDGRVFVDYSSLDIRHLGSIYEGLLEYHLNVADETMIAVKDGKEQRWMSEEEFDGKESKIIERVEEGDVYLTTDKGERKATGSYYTPEYIVQYIVENTLDPIIEDIKDDLLSKSLGNFANDFAERVFELKILDPAMGSGHFLTNAVDHLAREIVNAHEKQAQEMGADSIDESHDIHWARRQVVQRCIYGVDLNDMAVELAKVSLWLRTLAAQKPLAFLDHHLKTGNSLIGSDIEDIEELDSMDKKSMNGTTLEDFGMTWKGTMEDLMDIYQKIIQIENQNLDDIKEMEEKYHEFEHEPVKERLEAMANVHTAREFGLDIPKGAFKQMAAAIDDDSKWEGIEDEEWFNDAQKMTEDKDFFHWKLAYPEVFYEEDGGKKEDAGFDVVIGNPPYARIQSLKNNFPDMAKYYEEKYESSTQNFDIYVNFTEKGYNLLSNSGLLGYIEPHKFFQARMGKGLRKLISENKALYKVINFKEHQVFHEASVYTCILFLSKKKQEKFEYIEIDPKKISLDRNIELYLIKERYGKEPWSFNNPKTNKILEKIKSIGDNLEEKTHKIFQGLVTSADDVYLVEILIEENNNAFVKNKIGYKFEIEKELLVPFLKGSEIHRYDPLKSKYHLIFPYKREDKKTTFINENALQVQYPKCYQYFKKHENKLRERDSGSMDHERWYDLTRPQNLMEYSKNYIVTPRMGNKPEFTWKTSNIHHNSEVEGIVLSKNVKLNPKTVLAILNSKIFWFFLTNTGTQFRGGFYNFRTDYIAPFSLPNAKKLKTKHMKLDEYSERIINRKEQLNDINRNCHDYLGNYTLNKTLGDLYTPIEGLSNAILMKTNEEYEKLKIGKISFEKIDNKLSLLISARYKPENPEEFEDLDRWGYIETELIPVMKFTGSEKELALIEEFTKLAVNKGGGFANFREKATKTMSILDRLEKLTLPKLSDVKKGLEKYLEQKEKAERLEREIKETDHTIDAIVFDLYDLNEEEVETVLNSLDTPENEKEDIIGKFKEIIDNK